MNKLANSISLLTVLLLFLYGCSDEPGITGAKLVSPNDTVEVRHYTTTATSDTSYLYRVSGIYSSLIGRYGTIEARALMQFPDFSSIPDTAIIDSAILKIPVNYSYNGSFGTVAFDIHRILKAWDENRFTWDSSTIPGFYSNIPEMSFQKVINPADTIIISFVDQIRSWLTAQSDTTKGIILIPAGASTIIAGLVNASPTLTVSYRFDSADTTHTLISFPSRRTFVANGNIPLSNLHIFIQAGIGYRGGIRFDSLSLPRSVSITEATLRFTVDENQSLLNSWTRDTITAHFLRGNSYPYDTIALGTVCSPVAGTGEKVYQGNITSMVQQWVIGTPNYGIILRPLGEYTTFDRFAIYGAAAPDSLKPVLTITYTVFP